jgi:hypothetical protein
VPLPHLVDQVAAASADHRVAIEVVTESETIRPSGFAAIDETLGTSPISVFALDTADPHRAAGTGDELIADGPRVPLINLVTTHGWWSSCGRSRPTTPRPRWLVSPRSSSWT